MEFKARTIITADRGQKAGNVFDFLDVDSVDKDTPPTFLELLEYGDAELAVRSIVGQHLQKKDDHAIQHAISMSIRAEDRRAKLQKQMTSGYYQQLLVKLDDRRARLQHVGLAMEQGYGQGSNKLQQFRNAAQTVI